MDKAYHSLSPWKEHSSFHATSGNCRETRRTEKLEGSTLQNSRLHMTRSRQVRSSAPERSHVDHSSLKKWVESGRAARKTTKATRLDKASRLAGQLRRKVSTSPDKASTHSIRSYAAT